MYEIQSQIYEKTAQRLSDAMGDECFFSGSIEFTDEDVECRMLVTVMAYHRNADGADGGYKVIDDLVPIWWEFHTFIDGQECINDFDFGILKSFIIA